jgi:hypothetical protein
MSGLQTLATLAREDRALVLRTLPLVAGIRVGLWIVPFRRLQAILGSLARLPLYVPPDMPVSRLVWAVRAASRRVPAASCLTQALALQCLLTRAGRASEIHIGVARDPQTGFQAHAWVECAGTTLLSDPAEMGRYVTILGKEMGAA